MSVLGSGIVSGVVTLAIAKVAQAASRAVIRKVILAPSVSGSNPSERQAIARLHKLIGFPDGTSTVEIVFGYW